MVTRACSRCRAAWFLAQFKAYTSCSVITVEAAPSSTLVFRCRGVMMSMSAPFAPHPSEAVAQGQVVSRGVVFLPYLARALRVVGTPIPFPSTLGAPVRSAQRILRGGRGLPPPLSKIRLVRDTGGDMVVVSDRARQRVRHFEEAVLPGYGRLASLPKPVFMQ